MECRQLFSIGRFMTPPDAAAIRQRIGALAVAGQRGDADLNPEMTPDRGVVREAAVLIPLMVSKAGISVLLTLRTDHLIHHAGQISFPGGRIEGSDSSPEAAALREAEEEVGIDQALVDVIGRLDQYYIMRTRFSVTPVVGMIQTPVALAPDPFEVAEVFEVPLSFVLDPANIQRHSRVFDGCERQFYALTYEGRYIWGATAGMLVNLRDALNA